MWVHWPISCRMRLLRNPRALMRRELDQCKETKQQKNRDNTGDNYHT